MALSPNDLRYQVVGVRRYGAGRAVDIVWTHREQTVGGVVLPPVVLSKTRVVDLDDREARYTELTEIADQIDIGLTETDIEVVTLIEARRPALFDDLVRNGVGQDDVMVESGLIGMTG